MNSDRVPPTSLLVSARLLGRINPMSRIERLFLVNGCSTGRVQCSAVLLRTAVRLLIALNLGAVLWRGFGIS
jgi:hypothetical protein